MGEFFQKLKQGMEEAVGHERGMITLRSKLIETPQPPKAYSSKEIKKIRIEILNCSQQIFALIFGVSVKTVQAWETEERHPTPAALRLLELIEDGTYRPALVEEDEISAIA